MPRPLALCLEDLGAEDESQRFLQCVATVGAEPGLSLDGRGEALWQQLGGACEIWVSGDDRLMLYRPPEVPDVPVNVHRGGRSRQLPTDQPLVLLHGDELQIGERHLKLHIHGEAEQAAEPQYFVPEPPRAPMGQAARLAAAALALGSAVGLAGVIEPQPSEAQRTVIEVRAKPPKIAPPKRPPKKPPGDKGKDEDKGKGGDKGKRAPKGK